MKTRDFLKLIPETEVTAIERCSGHDGTYAVKAETYDKAKKIAKPVVKRVIDSEPDEFGSDCPMAGRLIAEGVEGGEAKHPVSMVRQAYGI
jgi:Fe-S oxidoreductase